MGFWAWFWIWTVLILSSLAVFAFIGKSLFNRLGDVLHQFERMSKPALALAEVLGAKTAVKELESDLLTPVGELEAQRAELLRVKSKKQAARQRRLISGLKKIDLNESRFTND
ncbi:MAG: hypothetical protein ACKOUD_03575 [Rhodoluna sp.]